MKDLNILSVSVGVMVLLSVASIVGLVVCSTSGAESNAAKVVENCLEAKRNNDYEAMKEL